MNTMSEVINALSTMTALVRLKYGNLDSDVYQEILKAEAIIKDATDKPAAGPPRVLIEILGGVCQMVYADGPVQYKVKDWDNIKEDDGARAYLEGADEFDTIEPLSESDFMVKVREEVSQFAGPARDPICYFKCSIEGCKELKTAPTSDVKFVGAPMCPTHDQVVMEEIDLDEHMTLTKEAKAEKEETVDSDATHSCLAGVTPAEPPATRRAAQKTVATIS